MILRTLAALALVLLFGGLSGAQAPADPGFQKFLTDLWVDAQKEGITRKTFDLAFHGVTPQSRGLYIVDTSTATR